MGIGNSRRRPSVWSIVELITPHGDWERGRVGVALDVLDLITPHGDWERQAVMPRRVLSWNSLPLMGIGNRLGAVYCAAPLHLITPHGDWERRSAASGTAACTSFSLPLMGIGNHGLSDFVGAILSLSLPLMGIGNADGQARRSRKDLLAHYPSWGLGTLEASARTLEANCVAHYPSWGLGTR